MGEQLDSEGLRLFAYAAAAIAALLAGRREEDATRQGQHDPWSLFWYLSAALLLVMGVARVTDIDEIVADFGRRRARSGGWYDVRQGYQAAVIGVVASIWGGFAIVAIWRSPARRQRYLPAAIVLLTLVCFAVIRLVSLHDVDEVLYRRDLGGVRIVAVAELALLAASILSTFWFPFARRPPGGAVDQAVVPGAGE